MGWRLTRRITASAALVGALVGVMTVLPPARADDGSGAATSSVTAGVDGSDSSTPLPPRLPRDFSGKGTWIVRDLGITVPFTWAGRDGDSQMTAGGPQYPIWFTNLIYHGSLYTLTYKWPNLRQHACSKIPGFDLDQLNQLFRDARFVGPEVLQGSPDRTVNHWRVGIVAPTKPPGSYLRFPLGLGDIYVDQNDRTKFWQVLQFGLQNLFDPELDEWLVMDTFDRTPGTVRLPLRCALLP